MKKAAQFNQRYVEIDITKIGSHNVEKSRSPSNRELRVSNYPPI
jgi:hypothetical protein